MREWVVAGGLVEGPGGLLLVRNRRAGGRFDWTPPGGVVEVGDGESVVDGLTREVQEETGILVTEWAGPVYEVTAEAAGMGWRLRAEVHVAVRYEGDVAVADPDGIVVDAGFFPLEACAERLAGCDPWVREPLGQWLAERWVPPRAFAYRVDGDRRDALRVVRL
ncbi:MAG TPA: NUDIX hydrolase [Acidimicrobiales bacterium]